MAGEWVDNAPGINQVVLDYFSNLFSRADYNAASFDIFSNSFSMVSEEDNLMLTRPFSSEEFRDTIASMHADKALGPDGFNPGFYKKFWGIIGEDVAASCISWLINETFPTDLFATNVILIPKCDSPTSMKDLRPILICNVIYKILAKVLCNRLKSTLPLLINPAQSAFVASRSIHDNILIAFETIHAMKNRRRGKVGDVALKIDISKAYDTMDWDFLEFMHDKLGFCPKWIRWIMLCVKSVSYNFVVNDSIVGPVISSRGIRQGDLLSPYLFIIC